ncbi:MAG: c-type cytochrome [Hyphomonadaceae bacterium]|nr:c-type cytochrome [Hyphomonadaceae bacterium]
MFTRSVSLAAVLLFIPMLVPAAEAQEFGNAARGRAFAAQICSDCHQTEPGNAASPDSAAPPFTAVAKTKGMTAMALGVWLQTSHPTMPNIKLKPETMDDIISYILSLRPNRQ